MFGKKLDGPGLRDAVHVACIPAKAGTRLVPGDRVELLNGEAVRSSTPIGIVDPFLDEMVQYQDWFWLLLLPGTVTGMRHEWSHPSFDTIPDNNIIERVATICGYTPERLLEIAMEYSESGQFEMDNSEDYKEVSGDMWVEFWKEFNRITGKSEDVNSWAPFTCSC